MQIINFKTFFGIIISALLLSSCADELFSPSRNITNQNIPLPEKSTYSTCSNFTHIKPQVDFLFIWDNSTSTYFINEETKRALNNTLDLISSRFDYHVMVAPLIGTGNNNAFFMSETPDGLSSNVLNNLKVDRSLATQKISSMPTGYGSNEMGLQRAVDLLRNNRSNGIFRENAYTMIVIMSNTDDTYGNTSDLDDPVLRQNYLNARKHDLLCLRGNYSGNCSGGTLNSQQMRFMSIVLQNHPNHCSSVSIGRQNYLYRWMSQEIYYSSYTDGRSMPSDQFANSGSPDSYDICNQSNFSRIFDGINNTIQDQVVKHKYNYWPVALEGAAPIDPNEIRIQKNTGATFPQLTPPVSPGQSGFTFQNTVQTVNTRYEPTPGEPFTGYVVELHGDARVTYPECLTVTTQTPKEYYGYIHLHSKPQIDSIELRINGENIPRSTSNGWEVMTDTSGQPRYFDSLNMRIQGPTNDNPKTPGMVKSGYFLKLYGDAIYSNGANIQLSYLPDGN